MAHPAFNPKKRWDAEVSADGEVLSQLLDELRRLPMKLQRTILIEVKELAGRFTEEDSTEAFVRRFGGVITHEEAELMRRAIEEEFEAVDE